MYTLHEHGLIGGRKTEYETLEGLTEAVYEGTCSLCKDGFGTSLGEMLLSDCGSEYSVEGGTFTDSEPVVTFAERVLWDSSFLDTLNY